MKRFKSYINEEDLKDFEENRRMVIIGLGTPLKQFYWIFRHSRKLF